MSTPTERVREFLRQYEQQTYPSQQVQTIHGRRHGELQPDTHLYLADLHALLTAAQQPAVLGYGVAGREGILHHNLPRPQHEAELIRDEWTRDLPADLDWDYRVVAITEMPTQEATR